jgi:2,4-dienoyl-CoA reductase-like NADH-dependent reductase (Old Yellow Enzyme family)
VREISIVYEDSYLAGLKLKNRIIRSATFEGLGDLDGSPSKELTDLYIRLAKGGVGTIITGLIGVKPNGKAFPNQCMLDKDSLLDGYKTLTSKLKEYDVPLIAQLAHAGASTSVEITGEQPVGPSKIKSPLFLNKQCRELNETEIDDLINNFVQAIARAKEAGFNGVQLHAAHAYLLQQFLSPRLNKRTDRWGGTTENRFRIIGEIITKARTKVGQYPIFIKLNGYDTAKGGMTIEESIKISKLFEQAGGDGIEVSCGSLDDAQTVSRAVKYPVDASIELIPWYRSLSSIKKSLLRMSSNLLVKDIPPLHNYNVPAAKEIKKSVRIPIIVVGGIRSQKDIESIILSHESDYVAMCRPFIIEPDIVNKMQSDSKEKSGCIDCSYCIMGIFGRPLRCYHGKLVAENWQGTSF